MDANEHYLNQHMSKLDADETKMQWIVDRANSLMEPGEEYYPFSVENVNEALSNLNFVNSCLLAGYIKIADENYGDQSAHVHLADFIKRVIREYWVDPAMKKAEEEYGLNE